MRDNLNRFPQIIATAFLVDNRLVDSSGGDVVGLCGLYACETFVVPEVKVSLMSVDCDVALAMLIRVEGARVDVDVWVKFLDSHSVAS